VAADDYVLAVDLGGSLTKIAYADADGRISTPRRLRTELTGDSDALVRWLAEQISSHGRARAAGRCLGYGVVVPGIVDTAAGRVLAAPNVGWYDVPLQDRLTELTGLSGAVGHDVRSAGLAEWRGGAGQGADNLLFLPLGTGIAAAMVVDGRQLDAHGYAGELGHIRVAAAGQLACACGQRGCLETVASASGVVRSYRRLTDSVEPPGPVGDAEAVSPEVGPAPTLLDARGVAELARGGDPAAQAAFALVIEALTEALVLYLSLLGPELIIVGGGLSAAADLFLPQVGRAIEARLAFQRMPRLVTAALGADAGVIGAGLVGWDAVRTRGHRDA
jgi:glucokinase